MTRNIVVLLAALLCAVPVCGDTIYLVNGDILSGEIVSMNESEVEIRTEFGIVRIERKKISRGSFGEDSKTDKTGSEAEKETSAVSTGSGTNSGSNTGTDAGQAPSPFSVFPFDGSVSDIGTDALAIRENTITAFTQDQKSKADCAALLKGQGEYIIAGASQKLIAADEFSVRTIFKMFNPLRTQYLLSMWESTRGDIAVGKFAVCAIRGNCILYLADDEGKYHTFTAEGILTPMAWNDMVISVSMARVRIYINGKLRHEAARGFGAMQKPDIPLHLFTAVAGKDKKDFSVYNLEGSVSELAIWDNALTRQQVEALQ
ncbi:MAG: hypothetical protein JW874_00075 [Spirochaetales bacterium]|nr:hypothetical protein [Spirochaetales bacterium]